MFELLFAVYHPKQTFVNDKTHKIPLDFHGIFLHLANEKQQERLETVPAVFKTQLCVDVFLKHFSDIFRQFFLLVDAIAGRKHQRPQDKHGYRHNRRLVAPLCLSEFHGWLCCRSP